MVVTNTNLVVTSYDMVGAMLLVSQKKEDPCTRLQVYWLNSGSPEIL